MNLPLRRTASSRASNEISADFDMTHSAFSVMDRRHAPRVRTNFVAEIISGTVLAPVVVHDLSTTGCGVTIQGGEADLPDRLGGTGVLHFPASKIGSPATLLPVVLRNVRAKCLSLMYGLEFRPLYPHQMRKLLGVMEAMAQEEAEGRP